MLQLLSQVLGDFVVQKYPSFGLEFCLQLQIKKIKDQQLSIGYVFLYLFIFRIKKIDRDFSEVPV